MISRHFITRICRVCNKEKKVTAFPKTGKPNKDGVQRRLFKCAVCCAKVRYHSPNSVIKLTRARQLERYKRAHPERILVRTARSSDKVYGRPGFDLDNEFVRQLISNGCSYCGALDIQMSLDRIDNNLAHMRSNVNATCIRCNNIRGSMPYAAWLVIVPAVKQAYEANLLGDWWTNAKSKRSCVPKVPRR